MAPVPAYSLSEQIPRSADASQNQVASYLATIGIEDRNGFVGGSSANPDGVLKRSVVQPASALLPRVAPTTTPTNKGTGAVDPFEINNKGILALFGLIFAGLVISAIWFFFWAKNGGFIFRKGDWEDYKSTVLRRKDKNGKTLSNATKSTDLGQASIAGEFDRDDVPLARSDRRTDSDMREYRHERPARVGGLNRKPDGSYYDYTPTAAEKAAAAAANKPAKKGFFSRGDKKTAPKKQPKARVPSTTYSFTNGDDDATTLPDSPGHQHNHYAPRSPQQHHTYHGQRGAPPAFKGYRDHGAYTEAASSNGYGDGFTEDGDVGTKTYSHYIPGVSRGAQTESSFERGERRGKAGYRRGEGRRRDSLSDSDG